MATLAVVAVSCSQLAAAAPPPRRDAQRLQNEVEREARDRLRRVEYQRQVEKSQREVKEREQRAAQERLQREAQDRARQQAAAGNAKLPAVPQAVTPVPKR
jgi:hypothetical protein